MSDPDRIVPPSWWLATAAAVLRRPVLWGVALRAVFRLAEPGWWRRPPFLPLPNAAYLRFRLETQYGNADPRPDDVVVYLRWLHRMRGILR